VPDTLVERELTSQLESLERSLNRQGLKLDRYLEYLGKSVDQWMTDERGEAEARLKVDLVIREFARREDLEPSEEDTLKFIDEEAKGDPELKGQAGELKKSASVRRYFASRLRRRRVLERLLDVVPA
jgi:trigger factor